MLLANEFHFNQANLQDFVDCRRRFYLKHVQKLAWPAIQSEPVQEQERHMRRGASFHRLIQQHLLGVPAEQLAAMIDDFPLTQWWQSYLNFYATEGLSDVSSRYPELSLAAWLAGYRLVAKYDLVVVATVGSIVIYDWKTSLKRPTSNWLSRRMQTCLYPYLLVRAGDFLNQGTRIEAQHVQMIYWFAEFPAEPEQQSYSVQQFQADEQYLAGLIATITQLEVADFHLTSDEKVCRYCVYRSLCERGVQAGLLAEQDESDISAEQDFNLDFDQIPEIAF